MRLLRQLAICVAVVVVVAASIQAAAPDADWSRFYSSYNIGALRGVTQTHDGGFAINGYSDTYHLPFDQWVVKINAEGDTIWTKMFGDENHNDFGLDIIESYDNSLIVLGKSGRPGYYSYYDSCDIRLMKLDPLGNEIWNKVYAGDAALNSERIIETHDRGFAIVGWTNESDVLLLRTNEAGDSMWTKTYGGSANDAGYDLCQTDDGGFLIVGSTESYGSGLRDVYVIRTDAIGDTLWTRTFGGAGADVAFSITGTDDGNFMISGWMENADIDVFLIKIQPNGEAVWTKTAGQPGQNDWGRGISVCQDGGFLVAGTVNNPETEWDDIYLLKVDANGDALWSYTEPANIHDQGEVALEMTEGGLYLFGTRAISAPQTAGNAYWVTHFGASGCCGRYNAGRTGNTDCDASGAIGLNDVTRLIDRVYITRERLCCEQSGNVDGDESGAINLSDITRLIDHAYLGGAETAICR